MTVLFRCRADPLQTCWLGNWRGQSCSQLAGSVAALLRVQLDLLFTSVSEQSILLLNFCILIVPRCAWNSSVALVLRYCRQFPCYKLSWVYNYTKTLHCSSFIPLKLSPQQHRVLQGQERFRFLEVIWNGMKFGTKYFCKILSELQISLWYRTLVENTRKNIFNGWELFSDYLVGFQFSFFLLRKLAGYRII